MIGVTDAGKVIYKVANRRHGRLPAGASCVATPVATKTISGRQLRHGAPEESVSPGEAVRLKRRDGKVFELRRVDSGGWDILTDLDRILEEIRSFRNRFLA